MDIRFPSFNSIKFSTHTIIAVSNITFDINLLFNYLPVTDYTVVKRKRGRKKKIEYTDPNKDVVPGSIISVQKNTLVRGVVIKKKKESKKNNYFLNAVTVIVVLEEGKLINVKISKNGKFQITGCKESKHFLQCIKHIYDRIKDSEKYIGENIITYKNLNNKDVRFVFNIVMKNKDFNIGFYIDRYKLDSFIGSNTNYISLFEPEVNTGVNIKISNKNPYDTQFYSLNIKENKEVVYEYTNFEEYLTYLTEKERKKEHAKIKHHTFLVFCSGAVIMSSAGIDMENVYKEFMNLVLHNRNKFEEKIYSD